jgi:hypothetical protein
MSKTRLFGTEELENLLDEAISDDIVDQRRWHVSHEAVFECEGKFYLVHYDVPATESQDCEKFCTNDDGLVECVEVEPHQEMVTKYHPVQ